ncbi:MAG: VOC family protein [Patescibacteria group bacterium]
MDKVQHFELPADDLARARKFYENTFGWHTAEWPMPDGGVYIGVHTGPTDEKNMVKESGFINGGMFKRGEGFAAKGVVITPVVPNINATIEKVKAAGGQVVAEPKTIPNMGIYAYIQDTEGNVIGLWQDLKKQ